jgi:hypothetical protein
MNTQSSYKFKIIFIMDARKHFNNFHIQLIYDIKKNNIAN